MVNRFLDIIYWVVAVFIILGIGIKAFNEGFWGGIKSEK